METDQSPTMEYLILGFLYENPMHGYQLIKQFKNSQPIQLLWQSKPSKIYFWLKRFEDSGLISGELIPGDSHPNRIVFNLTQEGEDSFIDWLQTPVSKPREMRISILGRLHFALKISKSFARKVVANQAAECRQWLTSLEDQLSLQNTDQFMQHQIIQYRISQVKGMIDWSDRCLKELSS